MQTITEHNVVDADDDSAARHEAESTVTSDWDGQNDPENPINWPTQCKWLLTGFACFMSFLIGINTLSISSAALVINERFGISDESFPNSYWTVTAWNVGAIVGPVLGLPLMENFGVRAIYLASYALFILFVIPQAVAPNFATLIVTRFFAGGFGSVVQNAVANVVGDIWVGEDATVPIIIFCYAYLMGFTLGPTFGSAVLQYLDWRWIFYIQLIIYGALVPLAWYFIDETRGSVILDAKKKRTEGSQHASAESRTKAFLGLLYEGTVRPAYLFCTEPVLFFFTIWSGLAVGNVFLASQSIAQTYGANYGFNDVQAGYIESSLAIGETIGLFICIIQARIYHKSAKKNTRNPGVPIPESRLELSIPSSFVGVAGGLFVYAWTSYTFLPWIAPTIGLGLVGVGIMVIVYAAVAYITDAYGIYGGSAIAAVAAIENMLSGFLPLATSKMYSNLGFNWASSLLAFVAITLSFAPVVLYIKGPDLRARSKFMVSL